MFLLFKFWLNVLVIFKLELHNAIRNFEVTIYDRIKSDDFKRTTTDNRSVI